MNDKHSTDVGRWVDIYLHTAHFILAYKIVPHTSYSKEVQICVRVGVQCESLLLKQPHPCQVSY